MHGTNIKKKKKKKERNVVWVPEDGDSCHKTGKIDRIDSF